ncbi:MAG: hypothetical protein IPQ25_07815 [Chitinophagaceae bacterium]|nr:hypothetical protein [Chitinophagaceae bacterium]
MRKTLAILLISVHLVGNTEAGQLFKLPQLLQHFFQHHHLDPSINFIEFIAMHYGGDDGTSADDDFDQELPWHNLNHHSIAVVYFPMIKEIASTEFSYGETKVYASHLPPAISAKHALLILQPPRLG